MQIVKSDQTGQIESSLHANPKSFESRCEKTGLRVSDQVRHKPGCTATEDGWRLEISDLGSRGIVLSM